MSGSFTVCIDESLLKGKVVEEYIFVRNYTLQRSVSHIMCQFSSI